MDEADPFLDDDLDDLPDNTLLELEQNAISSTQRSNRPVAPVQSRQQLRKQAHNASSLNRSQIASKNIPWRPPQRQNISQAHKAPPVSAPDPPSSQFDFGEEDVIDLDEPSLITEPSRAPDQIQRPSEREAHRHDIKGDLDPETAAAFAAADAELGTRQHGRWAHATHDRLPAEQSDGVHTLQARIAELETEHARLRQAEQQARSVMEAKKGEIAIVRANHDRERKEFDRRILAMQRSHAEDASKHKTELEAHRKETEKMQTDNRFLQHDLAQESERVKRLNGPGKARVGPYERDTPRKVKRSGLGDGFDDDEVQLVSPSKSKERPKDSTPKAGSKRKRSAQDSPVPALSFAKPPPKLREDSTESALQIAAPYGAIGQRSEEEEKYHFMQRLHNHRPSADQPRCLELLSRHVFPSFEDRSISAMLLDLISKPAIIPGEDYSPLKLARICLKLWGQCLEQRHYKPLWLILDLIRFAINVELQSMISQLVEEAVPLCLKSLELVTLPVVRAHLKGTPLTSQQNPAVETLSKEINAEQISDFLLIVCQAATLHDDRIEAFWQAMDFTSTMLMLHKALPMERVALGMRILNTSVLPNTFGAIHTDPMGQQQQEKDTVHRLTFALFDVPTISPGEPAYSDVEIAEFRLEVLDIFKAMCLTDHGTQILALHAHFIGRLVKFLDEQIRKLYTLHPLEIDLPDLSDDGAPSTHELMVRAINVSVRILSHLLTHSGSSVDLSDKFAIVAGGYHRFLICMSRIAFIEHPSVFDAGIEEDVIDAAHTILDAFLTPEDGEAIAQALETPRGLKSFTSRSVGSESFDTDAMETDDAVDPPG